MSLTYASKSFAYIKPKLSPPFRPQQTSLWQQRKKGIYISGVHLSDSPNRFQRLDEPLILFIASWTE